MITEDKDLNDYLLGLCKISSISADKFIEVMEVRKLEKGSVFIKKGTPASREYILLDGICRSFITNPKGEEITLSFFLENTAVAPSLVRTSFGKSILNVQAITNIKVATFLNADLMALMDANQEVRAWGNNILQQQLIRKVNKEITQISLTAKERLVDFRQKYPLLENQIPHSFIASFLGITNVSLSRIRKELAGK